MLRPSFRRLSSALPKLTIHNNPYKAQKQWPPDFTKLHPKHQFRFERKYRRRAKLKWARPRWVKGVKLAAWGSCLFVLVYGVLFMDWGEMAGRDTKPFAGIREWVRNQTSSIWTAAPSTVAVDSSGKEPGQRSTSTA
ncbi:hypothetical protein OEA41_006390 [Lepraria neglecta]|uniref:Uncharacterized protein n=1 Tax=Lepraria neglecta TaxID=209136 RepID=A0AAD9Z8S6_9LECA|nr:hypothetical protein OEA41_006390 [Lepraria neglecta]